MSWLNLNDSLNSLKGQISSFASGVLADGIVNDTDPFTELNEANQKIQELQNLCASQDVEITTLRRQNADFYEKLSNSVNTGKTTGSVENGDSCFWDPPVTDICTNSSIPLSNTANGTDFSGKHLDPSTANTIHELTEKIAQLKQENEGLQKTVQIGNQTNSDNLILEENQKLKNEIAELKLENKDLVQNLEQLDLDCQRTTDKLVTLKDNLQSELNKLKVEYDVLKQKNSTVLQEKCDIENSLKTREVEIEKLNTISKNHETELCRKIQSEKDALVTVQNDYENLKKKFENLVIEKSVLDQKVEASDQSLINLQKEHSCLKSELENFRTQSVSLEKHKKLLSDFENLQNKFTELELKNKNDQEKIYKLNNDFEEMKLNDNANMQINLSDDHKKLRDMFDEMKIKYEAVMQEKKEVHTKYIEILTENLKKYLDHELSEDIIQKPIENPFYMEFSSKVESILKLLLDFKWKTETLERKLCEITHEKTVTIAEKNHEIEKLLRNSEILSQEVITKTQTIKNYELECAELMKNNDMLISELQQFKNNIGLQTISESNEDNLLLMETQLENANKRIRELELVIADMENAKQDVALETQTELDYIKKQLNMTGKELSQSKKEYQDLLKTFKQYDLENNNLKMEINKMHSELKKYSEERQSYIIHIEKIQSDMENIEYKYSEANIERETISQELWSIKEELSSCIKSNTELNLKNDSLIKKIKELSKELEDAKKKYESEVEKLSKLEEKSQNMVQEMKTEIETLKGAKVDAEKQCYDLQSEVHKIQSTLSTLGFDSTNIGVVETLNQLKNKISTLTEENKQQINTNVHKYEEEKLQLQGHNEELVSEKMNLQQQFTELEQKMKLLENEVIDVNSKLAQEKIIVADLEGKYIEKRDMVSKLDTQNFELSTKLQQLENELSNLHSSKAELVNVVTVKHHENVQYHAEIQRLNQIIANKAEKYKALESQLQSIDNSKLLEEKDTEIEKLSDQVTFLKEKCEKLSQSLLDQQSNEQRIMAERQVIVDREQSLNKELERLRVHLVEIEDTYTQELLQAEQRNQDMQTKVNEVEQRERDSSTIYTSVSIRANQQVETLQNQLQLVTAQRDELQNKLSEAEDKSNKQFAALTNLQCVLEQFQKDKEIDIMNETERIRRQIKHEKEIQNQLQMEINVLKSQLNESKQGLIAASRLSEQLEKAKQQVVSMKDEVTTSQEKLQKTEEKYNALLTQTDCKVDKALIRNLVVGFVGANNNLNKDQTQILKIISSVLDFSQKDNDKLKLNKPQAGSWLSTLLHPQILNVNTNMSQQSLSEAFVRFLESESQPKAEHGIPTLLDVSRSRKTSEASNSSKHSGLLLNEVVLPTFADFAQSRSSSAILKDVLKDNNN